MPDFAALQPGGQTDAGFLIAGFSANTDFTA
jgi:hypothetical protein